MGIYFNLIISIAFLYNFEKILANQQYTPIPSNANVCGYQSCPVTKEGFINIHLVPHSHDDAGWLKTVDQYYYGARNNIQNAGVQYILDSVVEQLQLAPDRRFIYVESAFFWRWWSNRSSKTHEIVRQLVSQGRLEFIGGGWSMNDEADCHYTAIIDQMTLGLRFLNDTFGKCARPKVAWQIDPFGHSREQASLFAQMGFEGLFFGRLDYQDKTHRQLTKTMQTIWSGSPSNLGRDAWLFTGVLFNAYEPPKGFCFDINCFDEPINDDPNLRDYNVPERIDDFIKQAEKWAAAYRTNHVLMTMGSDFQYQAAQKWYINMDKLIKYTNNLQVHGSRINVIYSTPSCYVREVNRKNLKWSVKTDDFFPYASDQHSFWTGYFTSRPTLKYYIQMGSSFLQMCKQMTVYRPQLLRFSWPLEEAMGIAQHHDAVTGTAKQHVTDDYSQRIAEGMEVCGSLLNSAFQDQSFNEGGQGPFSFCHLANISSCAITESSSEFTVYMYNPLSRDVSQGNIRIPVTKPFWQVTGPDGEEIPVQIIPIPLAVQKIPGRKSHALFEITFPIGNIPGLSLRHFRVTSYLSPPVISIDMDPEPDRYQIAERNKRKSWLEPHDITIPIPLPERPNLEFDIENELGLKCTFDRFSGLLKSISRGEETIELSQNFGYYVAKSGFNFRPEDRASGAYIFRPNGTEPIKITTRAQYQKYGEPGDNVIEVHQTFSPWVSQIIRLYKNADYVEFEWLVGPIPVHDRIGKEVITRYSTNLVTNGIFFTDSNGRELLKRKRNFRETWNYRIHEPISGNYYPVNSRFLLTHKDTDLSKNPLTLIILNDRAQGGSSINDGEAEIMLHRRLLNDDAFGVGEALNEVAFGEGLVARGKHRVLIAGGKTGLPIAIHRTLAQEFFTGFHPAFHRSVKIPNFQQIAANKLSRLAEFLPDKIHLLTFTALEKPRQYLIRFEHIFESFDDPDASKSAVLEVEKLKSILNFEWIRETSLAGNEWRNEETRFNWVPETRMDQKTRGGRNPVYTQGDLQIWLNPMEIRTFIFYKIV